MGNGRWSGKRSGKASGKNSRSLVWMRALGAMVVLLAAGSVLLGLGSSRHVQKSLASVPASQSSTFSRASLSSMKSKPEARAILGQLPLIFEPNQGQADPRAKFLARGADFTLFLESTGAVLATQTGNAPSSKRSVSRRSVSGRSVSGGKEQFVAMKLVGANPAAAVTGADPLPGKTNYLIGNDPQKWHKGIPQFAGVHYASVYPGIDLVFYGHQGHLEYDFRVAPGADPSQAELQFEGAKKLKLSDGDLILTGDEDGGLRLQAPQIYQRDGDRNKPIAGRFVLRAGNRAGFEIGPYDHSRELIIDPVLSFSTYFGGSGAETSPSVAVNGDGSIYIAGTTTGSTQGSFPPAGAQTLLGPLTLSGTSPSHVFVAKILPSQPPSVAYETFIGGTGTDTSIGLAVDNGGSVYLVGNTSSTDLPTSNTNILGYQTSPETKTVCTSSPTCTSVFVGVLSGSSQIPGSTFNYLSYLSGNGNDQASGMTIDTQGDLFITGTTTSNQEPPTDAFPATQLPVPFQNSLSPLAGIAFFVTKVSTRIPSVSGIAYSTYFGGATPASPIAVGGGIAVDATGNIYFTGTTNFYNSGSGVQGDSGQSGDFPIFNAYQPCLDTSPQLVLSTPNPCTSPTTSPFPTDAFVAKINPTAAAGAQLLFSTYFGGSGTDSAPAIAIDSGASHVYLTGETNSTDFHFPTGSSPFQLCLDTPVNPIPPATCPTIASPVPFDAYVAQMTNPTLSTTGIPNDVGLTYLTYLGGGGNDSASAIAVLDSLSTTLNDVVIAGTTSSTNFPVTIGAIQSTLGTGATSNAFFAEINTTTTVNQNQAGSFVTYFGGNGLDNGTGIAVDPNLNTYLVGDTNSNGGSLETKNPVQAGLNGTRNAFVVELGTAASLCIATCPAPVVSPSTSVVSAGNQVTITFSVTNQGPDPATNIIVTGKVPAGVTFNSATAASGTCSAPSNNQVVCQIPTLQSGSASAVVFQVTPITPGSYSATAIVSSGNDTNTSNTASASFAAGGYSLQVSPPAQTITAGGLPGQYAVNLSPTQGTFGANVSLTCSALPTGAACNFTSTSVNLGNGPQSIRLNLTTTAQPETTITSAPWRRALYAVWLMVPGMALFGLGAGSKRSGGGRGNKATRVLGLLALLLLLGLVVFQPACSSNKTQPTVTGTPSGTYPMTITATSGSFTQTAAFSFTVIP